MSYEYRASVANVDCNALAADIARSLQDDGFATVTVETTSLAISVSALGDLPSGEHASVSVAPTEVVVAVHTGSRAIRERILDRVRAALRAHGLAEDFEEP